MDPLRRMEKEYMLADFLSTFLVQMHSFYGVSVQATKEEVTNVVSLVKMAENLAGISCPVNSF